MNLFQIPYNLTILVATVWALFFQDLADLAFPKSVDQAWAVLTCIVLGIFILDLIMNTLGNPKYFPSLYLFLDLLATASIVPDIPFIWDPILRGFGGGGDTTSQSAGQASVARMARAARAGTRAGRLVRLFKLMALSSQKKSKAHTELDESSVIGRKLADLTVRKVIVGIMVMVALIPLLNAESLDTGYSDGYFTLDLLAEFEIRHQLNDTGIPGQLSGFTPTLFTEAATWETTPAFDFAAQEYMSTFEGKLLYLRVWGKELLNKNPAADGTPNTKALFRDTEVRRFRNTTARLYRETGEGRYEVDEEWTRPRSEVHFDFRNFNRFSGMYNIILTLFIIALLTIGASLFSRDAHRLMIQPIERMVRVVRQLADNPLAKLEDEKKSENGSQFEVNLIEAALRKIGMLLQIGFGEAGADIIGVNLAGAGGKINPMVPGVKCKGIFGFCDIRNFTDATECLQEEVMMFVNVIAEIVHMAVKRHGGAPNKNIGDAFLVVYKTSGGSIIENQELTTKLADGSLQAFLDTISEINENQILLNIAQYPSIQARMPGYKTKMGFGLHYGYAIEGAIGSQFKIDASYLSPHVNIAARLESATKGYGVPMLISGTLWQNLSPAKKAICRRIDKVTLKGSKQPMELFCVDLEPPPKSAKFPGLKKYWKLFDKGIVKYYSGHWAQAGMIFQSCIEAWPTDEPARNLLWYMSRFNFKPPKGWKGFRELNEK
jgi:class 3 adenylate cyclase